MSDVRYVPTPYSYSSAVVAGDYVFLGLHRGSGGTFGAQLEDTFRYLADTLAKVDLTVRDIVKVSVWLKDIKDLPEMEKAFLAHFPADHYPARMTATTEFIDDDCLLMIEGVAYRGR